ncbi:histone acetyltransferase subunit NuA4, partial [Ostertagia ostertagi]
MNSLNQSSQPTRDMAEGVSTIQESENTRESSPGKLEKLVAKKTEVEEVLTLLENQIYAFEGDLLSNSFYGSILNGWNRAAFSILPSQTDPASLKRNFQDDERIFSRSSVEFMKRKRREAVDQENRSHGVAARQQRTSTSVNRELSGENNKRTNVVIKTEPRSPSPENKRSKLNGSCAGAAEKCIENHKCMRRAPTRWNRAAFSILPSQTDPASLKRNFQDDERIFSRSSVEFMKRKRREAVDQENRSHGVAARQQRTST